MKGLGLSKREKVKNKNEFSLIYSSGNLVYSSNNLLKAHFYFQKQSEKLEIRVGFAVHKKAGKAVWRNRMKRLLREAYRLNKEILYSYLSNIFLLIVFSPNNFNEKENKKIKYSDVLPELIDILNKIKIKVV